MIKAVTLYVIFGKKNGLTQAELASMLSVTPAAVSKWENGESKPKTDTLFKLADILKVRAEEIIKGEYIDQNSLDEKAVDEIYKRYEYLQKVDSAQSITVRVLRLLAWLIDWLICGTPTLIASLIFILLFQSQKPNIPGKFILLMLFILLFPLIFVLRDVLLNGRSLGKRCLGLIVLDKKSGEKAGRKQCLLLNLFFFISSIDAIVLLSSGFSVGDRVAGTVVTKKEEKTALSDKTEEEKSDAVNAYKPPKKLKKKKLTIICLSIAVFVIFAGISIVAPFIGLNVIKTTPEYEAAYGFFVNSEDFSSLGVSDEEIRLCSFHISRNGATGNAEFSFLAAGKKSDVTCHYTDGEWVACPQCYNHAKCEYIG
ncbi:MAG: helix-turn-helix domain-containing protein [Acutalibacteraceae bacterium]